MIPMLIGLAARFGVPEPFRKAFAWFVTIIGALAAAATLFFAVRAIIRTAVERHDDTVITTHDADINNIALAAQAMADRAAGANDTERMANIAAEQQSLEDARNEAMRAGSNPWDAIDNRMR